MRDAVGPLLVVALLMLAGCTGAPAHATQDVADESLDDPASTAGSAAAGSTAPAPSYEAQALARTGCRETQAHVSADPEDFSGLPTGYSLVLDDLGQATLAFLHQACDDGETVLVFVLLEFPEGLRRADAVHGGVVMAWSDDNETLAALHAWGFASQWHRLQAATDDADAFVTTRIQGDPHFLLTVHAAGDAVPLPYERLRLIDADELPLGAVIDRERPAIAGREGAATAHLLPRVENPGSDHRAGLGAVSLDPVDAVLALVAPRP